MKNQIYYRPEWICGHFHENSLSAIVYDLLLGKSFFFDSDSAKVIGYILNTERKAQISFDAISQELDIDENDLYDFARLLSDNGIIIEKLPNLKELSNIRKQVGLKSREFKQNDFTSKHDYQSFASSAEQEYMKSISKYEGTIGHITLELTYVCSERCIHCYNDGATRNDTDTNKRKSGLLNIEDYKRIIDEIYDAGCAKVLLTGGDPFSKQIVWDVLDYLYSKNIAIEIYTNGQAIVDKTNRLLSYWPSAVGLSIYSTESDVHDAITRVKGSWSKTMKVAHILSENGVILQIKCVVFNANRKSYYGVRDIAANLGGLFQLEVNLSNGVDGDVSITENLALPDSVLSVILRDKMCPLYVGEDRVNYGAVEIKPTAYPCSAGHGMLTISPDGEIHLCVSFPLAIGNIKETSLGDILRGKPLATWKSTTIADLKECGKFPKCGFCVLCCANSFIEHGTVHMPSSISCRMAEIRYQLSEKIKCGQDPIKNKRLKDILDGIGDAPIPAFKKKIANCVNGRGINGFSEK